MILVYPKIDSKLHGMYALKKHIDQYKGIELQVLALEKNTFSFTEEISTLHTLFPNLKEVTVHPPASFCDLEKFLYMGEDLVCKQLEEACALSEELGIQINILYHVNWPFETYKKLCLFSIKKMLNTIRGYHVYILLENTCQIEEKNCTPLKLCKLFGESNLKVCVNLCNLYKSADIQNEKRETYIKDCLPKEEARKYIYQIHFAYQKEEKNGIQTTAHESRKELVDDVSLLLQTGLDTCIWTVDINEEKDNTKQEQMKEIETLEDVLQAMNRKK